MIGDILACPKCGSMVQVVPPVGWSRSIAMGAIVSADAPPVESWPPTVAARGATASQVASAQPRAIQPAVTQPATIPSAVAQPAVSVPPALPPRSVSKPPVKVAESVSPQSAAAVVAPPTPPPIVSPLNGTLASGTPIASGNKAGSALGAAIMTRIKADWMLYGGGLAAGALLGACVWLFIAMQDSAPQTVTADAQANVALEPAPQTSAQRSAETAAPPIVEPAAEPTTAAASAVDAVDAKSPAQATQTAVEPPDKHTTPDVERPTAPKTVAEQPDGAAAADAPVKAPSPAFKLDPIAKPSASAKSDPPATGDASAAPSAADEAPQPRPLARPAPAASESAGSPTTPSLSKAQIEERLGITLPTVAFVKVPLAQFVDFIGDFTALSITIDDLALAKAGKKRQTPVTVQLSDATAREALDAAIKPLGLTCVVRGSRLVVTADPTAPVAK